nr:PREDICTED: gem-associated protein 2 [Opisthocomus hoazin]
MAISLRHSKKPHLNHIKHHRLTTPDYEDMILRFTPVHHSNRPSLTGSTLAQPLPALLFGQISFCSPPRPSGQLKPPAQASAQALALPGGAGPSTQRARRYHFHVRTQGPREHRRPRGVSSSLAPRHRAPDTAESHGTAGRVFRRKAEGGPVLGSPHRQRGAPEAALREALPHPGQAGMSAGFGWGHQQSCGEIEAARCPDVVVAQIDPKKLRRKQTVNISISGCQPAPEGYSPTLKWQQQQVANFSAVRQSLNKHRNHWRSQHLDSNVTMPKSEDEEGWKKFCLGERVYSEINALSDNENLGIDYIKVGFPPLLSIVSRMNQATVTSVLEYLISWFGEKKFTPELGRWLYALLACLEKPLLPEAHSLIRQLARRCSEVRVLEENKNEEQISALNLLICLVSRYFDQRDLADEPS